MRDKNPYSFETIIPNKVYIAAAYLTNQPLYQLHNITLSHDWLESQNNNENHNHNTNNRNNDINIIINNENNNHNNTNDNNDNNIIINNEGNNHNANVNNDINIMNNNNANTVANIDNWDETVNDEPINPIDEETLLLDEFTAIKFAPGKSQRGLSKLLKDTAEEVKKGNYPLQQQLRSIVNVFINKTEISAQEIAYHLLGMPLSVSSRQCIYINTSPANERCHLIKSRIELQKILENYPNSIDITEAGIVEHYTNRPDKMETWCLADFASKCQYSKTLRKNNSNQEVDDADDDNAELYELLEVGKKKSLKLKNNDGYIYERKSFKIIKYRNYSVLQDEDTIEQEINDALQDVQDDLNDPTNDVDNNNNPNNKSKRVEGLAIYEIEEAEADIETIPII
ncbi:uncharacterized protein DDB_G0289917 [Cephus cinctus]|uniref:Uncharacterized protein DDB_G0289917 n=1 Tax=Cephus cinctus TaxID=211228 RepID=A0AAJ7BY02_CEPCN|nr:uncharacterized protein DDB_G0289917 [Cephus cinctus]